MVLVLHGGRATDRRRVRGHHLAYLRMRLLSSKLHRAVAANGVAVWQLRNRLRGWNEPDRDPVTDASWALDRISARHPDVPVVLVGHSMGGRAALRAAGRDAVTGVCALAPWTEAGDPVRQLHGRAVLIAHGTRDRTTSAAAAADFADRAAAHAGSVRFETVPNAGHALLRRRRRWDGLVRRFTGTLLHSREERP
ncbi:alpha/beta fold hydrolase [Saccharopolyspora sp. HNM0983]|uniref:Alpha/beta fold hydrolase n=1 Tax=Saccharopolyspora montiporae TaxID=2781240 RepID=A0A929B5Y9_9PSEU|nr:alpha/beta fold hydrolase [Saccharopolyspora sp. HNM0983]